MAEPELYWGLWYRVFFPWQVINLYFSFLFIYLLSLIAWVTKSKRRGILAALALLNMSCSQFRRMALVGGEKQQHKEKSPPVVQAPCFVTLVSACPNSLGVVQLGVKSYASLKFRWRMQTQLLQRRSPGVGAWRCNTKLGLSSMRGERSTASVEEIRQSLAW